MASNAGRDVERSAVPSAIGQVKGGKLKRLALSSDERSAAAPRLRTMKETGLKSFSVTSWAGLLAPGKTPKAVVDKLAEATDAALQRPLGRAAGIKPKSKTY